MSISYPNRPLTAHEYAALRLTPAATAFNLTAHQLANALRREYTTRADAGDDPNYRGRMDRDKVDRDEGYEVEHFVNNFCNTLRISTQAHGIQVAELLHEAPSHLVSRARLQDWVWEALSMRATPGLFGIR